MVDELTRTLHGAEVNMTMACLTMQLLSLPMVARSARRSRRRFFGILSAGFASWLCILPIKCRAENCAPPDFYLHLPRDTDWYYGTAKDADTDQAREHAIRNLGRQVTGDMDSWAEADIDQVAGPGHDRSEVAEKVGKLLPTTLLAGWEQDDGRRCAGISYVLVRIEKEQVHKYIKENQKFRKDLVTSLTQRVEKMEGEISSLQKTSEGQAITIAEINQRLDRLQRGFEELGKTRGPSGNTPSSVEGRSSARRDLQKRIVSIRSDLRSGRSPVEIAKKLVVAEGVLSQLQHRIEGYDARRRQIEDKELAHFKEVNDPEVASILRNMWSGPVSRSDVLAVTNYYLQTNQPKLEHDFYHRVEKQIASAGLAPDPLEKLRSQGRLPQSYPSLKETVALGAFRTAQRIREPAEILKDGEAFLKNYPESPRYEEVKSEVESEMHDMKTQHEISDMNAAKKKTVDW